MVRINVRMGDKGQIVIPKIIRESVGFLENRDVILEVRDKRVEIKPFPEEDLVKKVRDRAKRCGADVSKWIYGDKLYEHEFSKR